MSLAEWVEEQASCYRSLDTLAADWLAHVLDDLAANLPDRADSRTGVVVLVPATSPVCAR